MFIKTTFLFFFIYTRSFFEEVPLCLCTIRFGALFCFWNQIFPHYTMVKIRRAHLLCILKSHHSYGFNKFVCSYCLNLTHPIPFYYLRFWIGNPTCFAGFQVCGDLLERRVRAPRKRFALWTIFYQTLTQMRPRVPCYLLGPIEDKANSSRFGSSLPSHFLLFLLLFFFLFYFSSSSRVSNSQLSFSCVSEELFFK